jgi:FtsH-binding integral membrane protein
MKLNLLRAIKSTHKNPISIILHLMGLSLYIAGFALIVSYYFGNSPAISSPVYGIILFPIAVGLFLAGHKIEGNLKAMTLIIIIKYLRFKLSPR